MVLIIEAKPQTLILTPTNDLFAMTLQPVAYFAWGHRILDGTIGDGLDVLVAGMNRAGLGPTHFSARSDALSTAGAKPLQRVNRYNDLLAAPFAQADDLSVMSFPEAGFATVFDANICALFGPAEPFSDQMQDKSEEEVFRRTRDHLVLFATSLDAIGGKLEQIGNEIAGSLIEPETHELARVRDMGLATLYGAGANFHLRDSFYGQDKIICL